MLLLYSPQCLEGVFSELRTNGVLRSSLRADLLLYDRVGRLRSGYGVRVTVHDLPGALFGSKDHRDPKSERRYIFTSADLSLRPFYLHHVGKLGSYEFLDNLD